SSPRRAIGLLSKLRNKKGITDVIQIEKPARNQAGITGEFLDHHTSRHAGHAGLSRTAPAASVRLLDVPEYRNRRGNHARQLLASGLRRGILPERDIDHVLQRVLLDANGYLALLFGRVGGDELGAQGL